MEDFLWELKTERFLKGEMTPEELLDFEQEQKDQPELKEYVTLSKQLQQAISEKDWFAHKNTSKHYHTVQKWYQEVDVLDFKEKLQQHADTAFETEKKTFTLKKYWFPLAAACIALLLTIVYQFTTQPTLDELYTQYGTWNDTPSFIVQDQNTTDIKEKIELLYKNSEYQKCILVADRFLNSATTDKTNVRIYKGFSLVQLHQNSEALQVFKTISESDAIDASKGLWYMALVYLKTEDAKNLQETLKKITALKTNYKYSEALELLETLE
ncbi:hypothetical protein U8527_11040 [Kordia algicida OT-1]|uniref:Tetratricopeptide repeat protein n=1 Tax=Kordia algicida OT-1 TaxID=391587 RepID=A9EBX3_9FLAO|nr:hypothetical protein [Kordia algicida]EDP94408.1 hypothetical protein KAOT1_04535 [Kordia algicida OT-1]